jgi:hypothetical protein
LGVGRVRQAIQIGYAFATLAAIAIVITGWVVYRESASRAYAEQVMRAIDSYKALHSQYSKTLEQVGFKTRTINGQNMGADCLPVEMAARGDPMLLGLAVVVGEVPIIAAYLDLLHGERRLNEPRRRVKATVQFKQ